MAEQRSLKKTVYFLMLFSLQWLMRKHPKVNTCPFGWRIPAVVLLNNPTSPLLSPLSQCIVGWQINKSRRRRSPMFSLHNRNLWQCFSKPAEAPELSHLDSDSRPTHSKGKHVILNTSVCPGNARHNTSTYTLKDSLTVVEPFHETLWLWEQTVSSRGRKERGNVKKKKRRK